MLGYPEKRPQHFGTDVLFRSGRWGQRWLHGALALLVLFFFVYPVFRLGYLSIVEETGLGFGHFADVLQETRTWIALTNTVYAASFATLLSVLIGVSLAWLSAYTDIRGKQGIHVLAMMPFIIPSYIISLAWTQVAGPVGLINDWASRIRGEPTVIWNVYGLDGIIVVMGLSHFPLVYITTLSVLSRVPRDLEWAARSSGANAVSVLRKITLPLAMPGIAAGGLMALIASLDNFGIPAFLGIPEGVPVLSTLIYEKVVGFGPSAFSHAAVLSVLLALMALVGVAVQWFLLRKSATNETTAADHSVRYTLGKKRIWVEAGVWLFILLTSIVPLIVMGANALIKAYGLDFALHHVTLDHFRFILTESDTARRAIMNSAKLGAVTMLICMIIGTLLAYWRIRQSSWVWKQAEAAVALPYALPGMVFGLAMILTWLQPIPGWYPGLYGTMWMLLLAYVTRFMILQVKSSSASIYQAGKDVEEAARINGAKTFVRWRKILIPLIWPGVLTGTILVFLTAVTELTVSSLLWSTRNETIGVVIHNFQQAGSLNLSIAFSTLVVLLMGIVIGSGYVGKYLWEKGQKRHGQAGRHSRHS